MAAVAGPPAPAIAAQYFQALTNINAAVAELLVDAGASAPAGLPTTPADISLMPNRLINIPVDSLFAASFPEAFGIVGEQVPRFRVGHTVSAGPGPGSGVQSHVACLVCDDFVSIINSISTHAANCLMHAVEAQDEVAPKVFLMRGPMGMGKVRLIHMHMAHINLLVPGCEIVVLRKVSLNCHSILSLFADVCWL
jgi:hypothetical protein